MNGKIIKNTNRISGTGRIVDKLAAEKKKAFIAAALIILMVFMWLRVFKSDTPAVTSANNSKSAQTRQDTKTEVKIYPVELPVVSGRNDILTRDFFSDKQWIDTLTDGKSAGDARGSWRSSRESMVATSRLKDLIRLEAIEFGEKPCAFINDRVLSVGEGLSINEGTEVVECKVLAIEEDKIIVESGNSRIEIKLTRTKE